MLLANSTMYTGNAIYCTTGVGYLESNTSFCKEACKVTPELFLVLC